MGNLIKVKPSFRVPLPQDGSRFRVKKEDQPRGIKEIDAKIAMLQDPGYEAILQPVEGVLKLERFSFYTVRRQMEDKFGDLPGQHYFSSEELYARAMLTLGKIIFQLAGKIRLQPYCFYPIGRKTEHKFEFLPRPDFLHYGYEDLIKDISTLMVTQLFSEEKLDVSQECQVGGGAGNAKEQILEVDHQKVKIDETSDTIGEGPSNLVGEIKSKGLEVQMKLICTRSGAAFEIKQSDEGSRGFEIKNSRDGKTRYYLKKLGKRENKQRDEGLEMKGKRHFIHFEEYHFTLKKLLDDQLMPAINEKGKEVQVPLVPFLFLNGNVRVLNETPRLIIRALLSSLSKLLRDEKHHCCLSDLENILIRKYKDKQNHLGFEVYLINGSNSFQINSSNRVVVISKDLKDISRIIFRGILGVEAEVLSEDWQYLNRCLNQHEEKNHKVLLGLLDDYPATWSWERRLSYYNRLYHRSMIPDSFGKSIRRAIESLANYSDWKENVPDHTPLKVIVLNKEYSNLVSNFLEFHRNVFVHIHEKRGSKRMYYNEQDEPLWEEGYYVEHRLSKIKPMFLIDIVRVLLETDLSTFMVM